MTTSVETCFAYQRPKLQVYCKQNTGKFYADVSEVNAYALLSGRAQLVRKNH